MPPNRQKHGAPSKVPKTTEGTAAATSNPDTTKPNPPEANPAQILSVPDQMRKKLAEADGKVAYALRKSIVEPVFGQIKQGRGFRRFSFRGLANVTAEWLLVCATHNLLKIFRSGKRLPMQPA